MSLFAIGVAMLAAYPAGRLCARFGIPRVTGYLFTGILLGPSALARAPDALPEFLRTAVLTEEALGGLSGVKDLAQALILFAIGLNLKGPRLRSAGGGVAIHAVVESAATFVLVAALVFLAGGGEEVRLPLVLGAIAVATAPAATMLVLRELESHGPLTGRVITLVGLDNLISLLLFSIAFGALFAGDLGGAFGALGLAVGEGFLLGLLLSATLLRFASDRSFAVMGLGAILAAWGLARTTGANPLLAAMTLGATLANASPHGGGVRRRLQQLDYPVYVAFFVLAGADLHVDLLVGAAHVPGVEGGAAILFVAAYVIGRAAGKLLSTPLLRLVTGGRERLSPRTGLALMAQAGMAIALADQAVRSGLPEGELIQGVVLAAVAVFELIGPLCVRNAVVHAGEVKLVNLLPDRPREGLGESIVDTLSRLRRNLGLPVVEGPHDAPRIRAVDVMRRNFTPIRADMRFEELLSVFSAESYDQYPVVGKTGEFLGVISFPAIRSILFDDSLEQSIVAADLVTGPGVTCAPDTPLPAVIHIFEEARGEYSHLPVVTAESPRKVVGIVDQRGAMIAYRKHR